MRSNLTEIYLEGSCASELLFQIPIRSGEIGGVGGRNRKS